MTDFENEKGMSPPKVVSKILFLGATEIPKPLSERNNDRPFGRTVLQSEITRLYP